MHKTLAEAKAAVDLAPIAVLRDPDIGETDPRVIRGHVEGPHIFFNLHAGRVRRDDEAGDAGRVAVFPGRPCEDHHVGRHVHARCPHLLAVDEPARLAILVLANAGGLHEGGVRAVIGLGQSKARTHLAAQQLVGVALILSVGRELLEHQDERVVADDRVLGLQVIEQAKALGGQMLADHRHGQLAAALAAHLRRPGISQVPGLVGQLARFCEQLFPFLARQAVVVPIGAGVFAAVVEEPLIVVLRLQRLDLGLDEGVQFGQIVDEVLRQIEVHGGVPLQALGRLDARLGFTSGPAARHITNLDQTTGSVGS